MGRPQSRDHDVADDPGRLGGGGQRAFLLDDEGGVVLDAGDQRRVRRDDLGEQLVVGVAAIEDIKPTGLERAGQRGGLRNRPPGSGSHRRGRP